MGSDMILAADGGGGGAFNLLLLLAIPLVFYFLLIRPQSRRRKEQLQMQSALAPGARVLTTSGMRATVVSVDDDGIDLEIAPGVEVRFVKQAVMQVLTDDEEAADDELDGTEDEDGKPAGERIDLSKDETDDDTKDVAGEAGDEAGKAAADKAGKSSA